MSAGAWAAGTQAGGPAATPMPAGPDIGIAIPALEPVATGSTALIPLLTTESAVHGAGPFDAASDANEPRNEPLGGGDAGRPSDDLGFVAEAAEAGHEEVAAARAALPRLSDPVLRDVAEVIVHHHAMANERLARIARSKGWPLPESRSTIQAPAKGSASPDFDARWTDETIAGHERALALYRAQAQGGEDQDLREYARDTLPTLEQHLDWLRSLQK